MNGRNLQWIWLGLGAVLAILGGSLKALEVAREPGAFEFVFFRGVNYTLLIMGLVLILIGLAHELLFEGEAPK